MDKTQLIDRMEKILHGYQEINGSMADMCEMVRELAAELGECYAGKVLRDWADNHFADNEHMKYRALTWFYFGLKA